MFQQIKRDDSRKQLLKYQFETLTATKDPKEEQEMNDWLENLQLKSNDQPTTSVTNPTSSAGLVSSSSTAAKVSAVAFR